MKRNLLVLIIFAFSSWIVLTSKVNGPAANGAGDRTGSPVSSGTCSSCHSGGTFTPSITITIKDAGSNAVTSYIPGDAYTLEVQVSAGSGSPSGYGMQAVALLTDNSQAGDFTTAITANSQITPLSGKEYVEHLGASSTGFFQYSWTAPASGSGNVTFYGIGNVVNGNVGTSGDQPTSPASVILTEAAPVCSAPSNLTVTNITSTTADLSWTSGGANMWETEVIVSGNTPLGYGNAAINTSVTAGGLAPGITYDFYARDLCSPLLMITGAFDGPLTGGIPKCIEIYAIDDIADLSIYGINKVTNGGGSSGAPGTMLPAVSLSAGDYYYVSSDSAAFRDYFGFNADKIWGTLSINGDDAVELYLGNQVIDVFGDVNVDGTGQTWDYVDGWSYRTNGTQAGGAVFTDTDWSYSGINAVDGCTTNAGCGSQWPVGTFTTTPDTSSWAGPFTFAVPCGTIVVNETVNNISCNGLTDGNISLSPTGGGASYAYSWSNSATTASISGLTANTYDVTVTSGSCSVTAGFTITEPAALAITATGTDLSCNSSSDGTAMVTVTGGSSSVYSYTWSDGGSTASLAALAAGAYTVTVTSGSCSETASVTLTEPSAITVTNTLMTSVTCNGANDGALTVSAAGGPSGTYDYLWSNAATTASISGLAANSYNVTVTSGACSSVESYIIAQPAAFSVAVTVTDATTSGGSDGTATAVVGIPSSYTYLWNSGQTTQLATGLFAGLATVTVTDTGTGCNQVANGVVADPGACNITVTMTQADVSCNGGNDGTATAVASGGPSTFYGYVWSDTQTTVTAVGLTVGSYAVTVSSGSCSEVGMVTISEPALITGTDSIGICQGDSVLLGGSYRTTSGFYDDTLVASNTCDSIVTMELTVTSGANAGQGDTLKTCSSDGIANLFSGITGLTDSSGTWNNIVFGFPTEFISPALIGPDSIATYTYTLTSGTGACSVDSTEVTVVVFAAPNAGGGGNVLACVAAGSVNLMNELNNPDTGGVWMDLSSSGALTDSIFDVATAGLGTYNIIYAVPGNEGCDPDTAFITLDVISAPNAGLDSTLESCDDVASLDLSTGLSSNADAGGTWDNLVFGFPSAFISPVTMTPGSYDYTYTVSATGCVDDVATISVNVNASPDAGVSGTDTICFSETSFNLMTVLGGTPNSGGVWNDDNSTGALTDSLFDATAVGVGTYTFTYVVSGTAPCAGASATVSIVVDVCQQIDEQLQSLQISVYPNPTAGMFNVLLDGWKLKDALLTVTSIEGRTIHTQQIIGNKSTVDLGHAAKGIYFMTFKEEGRQVVKQLIIQ